MAGNRSLLVGARDVPMASLLSEDMSSENTWMLIPTSKLSARDG